MGEDSISKV